MKGDGLYSAMCRGFMLELGMAYTQLRPLGNSRESREATCCPLALPCVASCRDEPNGEARRTPYQ